MRAVVAIKGSGRGAGASNAARYIADSKLDPEREGEASRSLFSEKEDNLSYRKADRYLSGGRLAPEKNDLIHFSVSFHDEDFAALGPTDEERKQRLREAAREAMRELKSELHAGDWRWAAGIHLNTDHPHVHILIHKEVIDRETRGPRRVGKIPKRLLPHREFIPGGDSRSVEGTLGQWFLDGLDRAKQPGREAILEMPAVNRESAIQEKTLSSAEILHLAAEANPSIAGRELIREIIDRGPAAEPEEPPEVRNPRVALKNRSLDDPEYRSRPEQADWLGRESQDLRDLYEHGAAIAGDVLIIPAEEHELATGGDEPFLTSLSYAYQRIRNPDQAQEFHTLARTIAGATADVKTELEVFRYYYRQSSLDEAGRYLSEDKTEKRVAALNSTLGEMRALAGEMAKLETQESIEVALPIISLDERSGDGGAEFVSPVYNTAARKAVLPDESLRLPAGVDTKTNEWILKHILAPIDGMIEEGAKLADIRGRISNAVAYYYEEWPEKSVTQDLEQERRRVSVFLNSYVSHRLRDPETRAINRSETFRQAHERLIAAHTPEELNRAAEDILRRNLERSATPHFRQTHPEPLSKPQERALSPRERSLLFFGRAPDHHTAEMRDLRHSWGMSRAERAARVEALRAGEFSPSQALQKLIVELGNRRTGPALRHYRASILNDQMRNPGKLDLRALHERLPKYERDFLFQKIEQSDKAISLASPAARKPIDDLSHDRSRPKYGAAMEKVEAIGNSQAIEEKREIGQDRVSLRASAPRIAKLAPETTKPEAANRASDGSLQEYKAAMEEIEARLSSQALEKKISEPIEANPLLTREEKREIRAEACRLAWERLEIFPIYASDPAAIRLLSLNEAIDRLREDVQPRARDAAQKLDEMIRDRNLDRGIKEKTDFYYGSSHLSEEIRSLLSPGDRAQLQGLEAAAAATQRDLRDGVLRIESLRAGLLRDRHNEAKAVKNREPNPGNENAIHKTVDLAAERERDRRILGDAILIAAKCDCAVLDYETARDHGETFRFKIYDASTKGERRISMLDVERRAGARANRAADLRGAQNADDRRAVHQVVAGADLATHERTLKEHEKTLDKLVGELEAKATKSQGAHAHAERLAGDVTRKYGQRGEPPPSPFVERKLLIETLEEVVDHRFAGHAEKLERLRGALTEEHKQPLRSDREAARLAAQLFVAQTEVGAREERIERFGRTRHLTKWEIGGEKLSLADVDRRIQRHTDDAKLIGRFQMHLEPNARARASEEIERLTVVREEILVRIGERATDLQEKAEEAGKLFSILDEAHRSEIALRAGADRDAPEPEFLRKEIERAADNIETIRDPGLLQRLDAYEARFDRYAEKKETLGLEEIAGRARGREVRAEIFHRENLERLAAYESRRDLQPILLEKPDGSLATHRMLDLQPRTVVEWALRPLVETPAEREFRGQVRAARDDQQNCLLAETEKTKVYLDAAREIAGDRSGAAIGEEQKPLFTSKQAMEIEIYAERLPEAQEREHYLELARSGATDLIVSINPGSSDSRVEQPEREAGRETIEIAVGRAR